jgi:uncharacterized SAM-binding protein YcdF (DUF218 family)
MIATWLGTFVKLIVLPPMGPLLVAAVGLFALATRPRLGRGLVIAGVAALWLLATPAVGGFLVRAFGESAPLDLGLAKHAQAIVILGGGARRFAGEYGGATINTLTLERVRYGAYLARVTDLPVLVSGGSIRGKPPEALLMRNVLTREFSVPVQWTDVRSHNTHENAVDSARILAANGISRIILIGHSFDFPRSRKEFEAVGVQVIAAPIGVSPAGPATIGDFIPSAKGMLESYYACYEILANILFDITHAFTENSADTRATPPTSSPLPRGS